METSAIIGTITLGEYADMEEIQCLCDRHRESSRTVAETPTVEEPFLHMKRHEAVMRNLWLFYSSRAQQGQHCLEQC